MKNLTEELGDQLVAAWCLKKPVAPFTHAYPDIKIEEAYDVQKYVVRKLIEKGYTISGRKMGYTNPGMQKKMGLEGPSTGYLFKELKFESGITLNRDDFIQPGIETEIMFHLKKDLKGSGFVIEDIIDAIDYFCPSMEIVDMRQIRDNKTQRDSIGDEGAFGAYVTGGPVSISSDTELAALSVELINNGEKVASGSGENVMHDPINSLLWAANQLGTTDSYLKAGEDFMSGSFTPLISAEYGDSFMADFITLGKVTVSFI